MVPPIGPVIAVLHGVAGDVTAAGYLHRVLLHLVAVAGVAVLCYGAVGVVDALRAAVGSDGD